MRVGQVAAYGAEINRLTKCATARCANVVGRVFAERATGDEEEAARHLGARVEYATMQRGPVCTGQHQIANN